MDRVVARALAVLAVLMWGASYVLVKLSLAWLPPMDAAAVRYGGAAVILVALCAVLGLPLLAPLRRHFVAYLVLGGVGIAAFQAFLFLAIAWTSPVTVAVVMATTPVWTLAGAALILRERLDRLSLVGAALALAGALIAVAGKADALSAHDALWGDAMALLAALSFSFYIIGMRRSAPVSVPILSTTALVMVVGAVCLLPLVPLDGPVTAAATPTAVWATVVLIVGTVAAYLAWNRAIGVLGASEPTILYNATPVVAMAIAAAAGMPPTAMQVIGGGLVVVGVSLAVLRARPITPKP